MPRDGSFYYTVPVGTDGITDQTIDSGRYNAFVHDVERDLNEPRPIVAGGTGSSSASGALTNLGAEAAEQQVTNYDSMPFLSGSFWSAPGATSEPVAGHYTTGFVSKAGSNIVLHAYDVTTSGVEYVRFYNGTAWTAWTGPNFGGTVTINGTLHVASDLFASDIYAWRASNPGLGAVFLGNTGRSLYYDGGSYNFALDPVKVASAAAATSSGTGALVVAGGVGIGGSVVVAGGVDIGSTVAIGGASSNLYVRKTGINSNQLIGTAGNLPRWSVKVGDQAAESGSNAGSNFSIERYSDAGAYLATSFSINRNDGRVFAEAGELAIKSYVDTGDLAAGTKVAKTGDTMTGDLTIGKATPALQLNATAGTSASIFGKIASSNRWQVALGVGTESGGNVGSDCIFYSFNDAGGFLTTPLTITRAGRLSAGGEIRSMSGTITAYPSGGGNSGFYLYDSVGNTRGYLAYVASDNSIRLFNGTAVADIMLDDTGGVTLAKGYRGRAGSAGALDGNLHNIYWSSPNMQAWIDTTNLGNISITCDYRTKANVAPLESTWNAIKSLRPIVYTQAEYTPPGSDRPLFVADDIWRWGFLAHELQDSLLPSAAHGSKDSLTDIQSPNLLAIVAALTRALQEAMTRIEALEGRAGATYAISR
jgi:hypothetical protein